MSDEKFEFLYKSKGNDEEITLKFMILDKSFLSKDTFELALLLKEKYNLGTVSQLLDLAVRYLSENKDTADKLDSLKGTLDTSISTLNLSFEDKEFVKQSEIDIMQKLSEDTWGGVAH